MTNETFIIKASKVHNNKYIYNNIYYIGIKNKINILNKHKTTIYKERFVIYVQV